MKTAQLLSTTILAGVFYLGTIQLGYAEPHPGITTPMETTASRSTTENVAQDVTLSSRFIEHVNYARVALALKDLRTARAHLIAAQHVVALLKTPAAKTVRVTKIQSGRIVYQYETKYSDHYFPIETGPIELKKISNGHGWTKNRGIAVTDAEIVYLTLDLSGDSVNRHLNEAINAVDQREINVAQDHLEDLMDDVITVDKSVDVPLDKAQDNIALARSFIAAKNYDGARYALKHADDALDAMERDDRYDPYKKSLATMRHEVNGLEKQVAKKDPTLLNKVDAKMAKWAKELKSWANKYKPLCSYLNKLGHGFAVA